MSTIYSVYQISNYIKNMFRQDYLLSGNISVQGEVSNCKDHSTGLYFTLKDENAVLSCVMFRRAAAGLTFSLHPGDKVVVTGNIDMYPKSGSVQLYATKIEKSGAGELYEKYLKLREELSDMGMFAPEYKQPIPKFAQKIGVVTAPTGAVIQDIKNVARRRHPGIEIFLYPSLVQGDGAKANIVRGIETLDKMGLDVIIVGRGGGSIEDLWAFNEEIVARAIFDSRTPIISAVGHETDWTIADEVADLRAPTPSAAAELAVPDCSGILNALLDKEKYLSDVMNRSIEQSRRSVREYQNILARFSPQAQLNDSRNKLINYKLRLERSFNNTLENRKHRLLLLAEKLDGLSPLKSLTGGYSYVSDDKGKNINKTADVDINDKLTINVTDGEIFAEVTGKKTVRR